MQPIATEPDTAHIDTTVLAQQHDTQEGPECFSSLSNNDISVIDPALNLIKNLEQQNKKLEQQVAHLQNTLTSFMTQNKKRECSEDKIQADTPQSRVATQDTAKLNTPGQTNGKMKKFPRPWYWFP